MVLLAPVRAHLILQRTRSSCEIAHGVHAPIYSGSSYSMTELTDKCKIIARHFMMQGENPPISVIKAAEAQLGLTDEGKLEERADAILAKMNEQAHEGSMG